MQLQNSAKSSSVARRSTARYSSISTSEPGKAGKISISVALGSTLLPALLQPSYEALQRFRGANHIDRKALGGARGVPVEDTILEEAIADVDVLAFQAELQLRLRRRRAFMPRKAERQ
jgi:hypothetical protein